MVLAEADELRHDFLVPVGLRLPHGYLAMAEILLELMTMRRAPARSRQLHNWEPFSLRFLNYKNAISTRR